LGHKVTDPYMLPFFNRLGDDLAKDFRARRPSSGRSKRSAAECRELP